MHTVDWKSVVERHGSLVWRTAYRLLNNREEAADCFQDTFVSAVSVEHRQRVRNWPALLKHLATARALDRLRQRLRDCNRYVRLDDWASVASASPDPAAEAEASELSNWLRQALAKLPEGQSEALCMRALSQMSYRQISKQLGISNSAVKATVHRAREKLRQMLLGSARVPGL